MQISAKPGERALEIHHPAWEEPKRIEFLPGEVAAGRYAPPGWMMMVGRSRPTGGVDCVAVADLEELTAHEHNEQCRDAYCTCWRIIASGIWHAIAILDRDAAEYFGIQLPMGMESVAVIHRSFVHGFEWEDETLVLDIENGNRLSQSLNGEQVEAIFEYFGDACEPILPEAELV